MHACTLSPLLYCGHRYFAKAIFLPLFTCAGVYICVPVWNKLRQLAETLNPRIVQNVAVQTIGRIHIKRALVNTFMFCFAPLTRSSIEALTCVETCADEDGIDDPMESDCVPVLKKDMSVQCWRDDHIFTACFAATLLVVVAVVVPIQLLRIVRRAREQRDVSLKLRADDADRWFDELDEDKSGALEGEEITELHRRMGGKLDITALDPDGDHSVTKQEFDNWYTEQLKNVADSPFDVLYGTTTTAGYWWTCFFLLWLKTAINVLYTYGSARQLEWHIWMHMLLAISMFLMSYQVPYVADLDHHVALLALGSLAGVAHISSIFKAGTTWDPAYIVLTALLFLLPLLAFVGEKAFTKRKANQAAQVQEHPGESQESSATDVHMTDVSISKPNDTFATGVGELEIEHADDSDSPRNSVIDLIVAAAPVNPKTRGSTPQRPAAAAEYPGDEERIPLTSPSRGEVQVTPVGRPTDAGPAWTTPVRSTTPIRFSARVSSTPRPSRPSTPVQPVRADLGQLGLSTLRKQAVLGGASTTSVQEALNSDNAKQQMIEMVFQAQTAKFAAAELAAAEQLRLGALVTQRRQEQERAVQGSRAELAGLGLADLEERALLFGIIPDVVDAALDDNVDAKRALIELCIEAEFGAFVHEDTSQSLSPLPTVSLSKRSSTPTRVRVRSPLPAKGKAVTGYTAPTNSPSGGHLNPPPIPTATSMSGRASTPPRVLSAPAASPLSPRFIALGDAGGQRTLDSHRP